MIRAITTLLLLCGSCLCYGDEQAYPRRIQVNDSTSVTPHIRVNPDGDALTVDLLAEVEGGMAKICDPFFMCSWPRFAVVHAYTEDTKAQRFLFMTNLDDDRMGYGTIGLTDGSIVGRRMRLDAYPGKHLHRSKWFVRLLLIDGFSPTEGQMTRDQPPAIEQSRIVAASDSVEIGVYSTSSSFSLSPTTTTDESISILDPVASLNIPSEPPHLLLFNGTDSEIQIFDPFLRWVNGTEFPGSAIEDAKPGDDLLHSHIRFAFGPASTRMVSPVPSSGLFGGRLKNARRLEDTLHTVIQVSLDARFASGSILKDKRRGFEEWNALSAKKLVSKTITFK